MKGKAYNVATDKPRYTREHNSGTTITVPDFALSVRDIMTLFAQGLPTPVSGTGYFSSDFPDVKKMDIIDLWKLKRENSKYMKQLEEAQAIAKKNVIEYEQEMKLSEIEKMIRKNVKNETQEISEK